ncbi:hypothetical protein FOCC_FOCC007534, partial [Frankliniella occidentalis]
MPSRGQMRSPCGAPERAGVSVQRGSGAGRCGHLHLRPWIRAVWDRHLQLLAGRPMAGGAAVLRYERGAAEAGQPVDDGAGRRGGQRQRRRPQHGARRTPVHR